MSGRHLTVSISRAAYDRFAAGARAQWRPFSEVLDEAIVRALDDAERFPPKPRRTCKRPRVAHAARRVA